MYLLLYNIFLGLYRTAIGLAALWNPKAARWVDGRKGIFSRIQREIKTGRPTVWMHCSSLGEFEQGRPVLEEIRKAHPSYQILLTFFSPSGYEIRKNYEGADFVCYLPFGGRFTAARFLDLVQPSLILWIKYDYWYHYLHLAQKRKIPVLLISAIFREGQPFFKWYGQLHRQMLQSFTRLFVQDEDSLELLQSLGLEHKTEISGDTRFDRVVELIANQVTMEEIEVFCGNHSVIVAGSTWSDDEEELDHYANANREMRFIIAPHEIHESHLKEIEALFHYTIRYSALKANGSTVPGGVNTLIIDNIGMLSRLYRYATIAYIGGGFGEDGVHNILEAAVYGKPVVFGPVYDKFLEAVELVEKGGAFSVDSALDLEEQLDELFRDAAKYKTASEIARDYVFSRKGATKKILAYIQSNGLLTRITGKQTSR